MSAPVATVGIARARMLAWCRVLAAVAEQRQALEYRIWLENPDDTHLESDVRTSVELMHALGDFLHARRRS